MGQSSSLYFPFVALSKACRELHVWFVYWNNLTPPAAQKRALMNTSRLVMLLWDLSCLIYSSIKTIDNYFELFMSYAYALCILTHFCDTEANNISGLTQQAMHTHSLASHILLYMVYILGTYVLCVCSTSHSQ